MAATAERKQRLLEAARSNPELSAATLAERFRFNLVSVRNWLREAGLARPIGRTLE